MYSANLAHFRTIEGDGLMRLGYQRALLQSSVLLAIFHVGVVAMAQGGLAEIARSGVKGPIVVVDLVKFKPDGAARYEIYDGIAEAKLKDLGGSVIFRGDIVEVSMFQSEDWDRVTFRKYPSIDAVIAMAGSREYQGAFPNRLASVEKSFVYAYSGELPAIGGRPSPGSHPMNVVPEPKSDDVVYMLNLLRFKKDGGRDVYFQKYGTAASRHLAATGAGPVLVMKGLGPVIPQEEVDRLILVKYPSVKKFEDMVTSEEYKKILPFREEAIDLGLVLGVSMIRKSE
ncbi:DUF1330 domain-containing protein [bacterium AH-315-P07]|nr:DUF1330 domain-containing protein [bacterium AH-315-P07]